MDRRAFIEGAALALVAAPLVAEARPARAVPRIGVLGEVNPVAWTVRTSAADVECRWAGDRVDRLPSLAAELVEHDVDVVVTVGSAATRAAMGATRTLPIVFVAGGDPVRDGLVASVERPGGNVTGLSVPSEMDLAERRLTALRQAAPHIGAVGVMWSADTRGAAPALRHLAATSSVDVRSFAAAGVDGIERAFDAMTAAGVEGLIVLPDGGFATHAGRIVDLAARHRLPAAYGARSFVAAGGLMAVHGDTAEIIRRAAALVARILGGASPATLAVGSLADTALVVNAATARRLGLALPAAMLARASAIVGA
jgi:putative ABC transport system substrate-binding protein